MKKLHYYTDCPFFAGCENMLANFLNSAELAEQFDISFWYRYSQQYEAGLAQRVDVQKIKAHPIKGIYTSQWIVKIKSSYLRKLFLLLDAFILKYPLFVYNLLVLFLNFRKGKIDILHVNNGGYPAAYSCNAAVIAARLCGVKRIVYVVNNLAISYKNPTRWLDYPIDALVKRGVNSFVTGSHFAAKRLRDILHLLARRVVVIANGIHLRSIKSERAQFLQEMSLDKNRVLAVVVARLEKRKGLIYLLEAIQLLKSQGKTLPLLLIEGIGPEQNVLNAYIHEHHLTQDIILLGGLPHVFDLINAADFTILSSIDQEDFPNVVLEAMALGKPVIGSSIAGIPEQIDHGKTGVLVPPKEVDELAKAISTLMENESLRLSLGQCAQKKFLTSFTRNVAVEKYIDLYRNTGMKGEI